MKEEQPRPRPSQLFGLNRIHHFSSFNELLCLQVLPAIYRRILKCGGDGKVEGLPDSVCEEVKRFSCFH